MLRVRAFWLRLPCSSAARTPRGVQLAGEGLGAALGPGEDHRATGRGGQVDEHLEPVLALTCRTWWAMVDHRRLGRVGLVVGRVVRNRRTSPSTPPSSVAEKNSR